VDVSRSAARPVGESAVTAMVFASGRTVAIEDGAPERLMVTDPHGRFEVAIRFTAAGPVLEVAAIELDLRAAAALTLRCDRLHVNARDGITLESQGDLVQRVAGDVRQEFAGALETSARSGSIAALDGPIDVNAAEDARIVGRRVLLNP
jgi:uncharacterized protein (DUF2345 family)